MLAVASSLSLACSLALSPFALLCTPMAHTQVCIHFTLPGRQEIGSERPCRWGPAGTCLLRWSPEEQSTDQFQGPFQAVSFNPQAWHLGGQGPERKHNTPRSMQLPEQQGGIGGQRVSLKNLKRGGIFLWVYQKTLPWHEEDMSGKRSWARLTSSQQISPAFHHRSSGRDL